MESIKIRTSLGVFFVSAAALLTEVLLIRVFDVLFFPNISYMIISCSLFAYGIAGVYSAVKPLPAEQNVWEVLSLWSLWLAFSILTILPVMNLLPYNMRLIAEQPIRQLLYFGGMYLSLALPFFWAGRIFTVLFSRYAKHIRALYFSDLAGAALGSVLLIPFIKFIGPGGLLFFATAISLFASLLFSAKKSRYAIWGSISLLLIILPFLRSPQYFDFREHQYKRGVKFAREQNLIEITVWDPISKIDVINYETLRYIAYDGGSQTSIFYNFDGDFQNLKNQLPAEIGKHFWQRGVLVSHMLREGSSPNVLIIGSAGGQEIKAALMYGANHVDAVELVGAVVDLGMTKYSDYIGNLFQNPSVSIHVDEGRNFIRSNQTKYDIIQIFSNHTSSSIAAGTGASATNYLQTTDAYKEYFSHLNRNGILHINHFFYAKMITTAARAWSEMGWGDFEKHVIVYEYSGDETLPTLLIKMEPWTEEELQTIHQFLKAEFPGEEATYTLVVDPLHPENNSIPASYFTGLLSQTDIETAGIRIEPATDDRPYFNLLERSFNPFPNGLVNFIKHPFEGVALDLVTIFVTGGVALFYGALFIIIPLNYSAAGKLKWRNKSLSLVYFSCLGFGFIVIEFVFIQMFIHVIGSPLYTLSTILFTMLLSAGIGSFMSEKLRISAFSRWFVPFIGVVLTVILVLAILPQAKVFFLGTPLVVRILFVTLMIFPVGFFLGMPFPLGISTLESQPDGVIAWAWGMNGLFTIVGGLLAVIFSIQWGFTITLLIACATYLFAFLVFSRIRAGLLNSG
jgi:spermidine synthase